ncbi:hypothetical protein ACSBR1_017023 [Camellia fascicularis]
MQVKGIRTLDLLEVGPKKILDLMNIPWLTRENVASHLQMILVTLAQILAGINYRYGEKYRLYLSRLQKENELKASFGGVKQSDLSSRDAAASLGL